MREIRNTTADFNPLQHEFPIGERYVRFGTLDKEVRIRVLEPLSMTEVLRESLRATRARARDLAAYTKVSPALPAYWYHYLNSGCVTILVHPCVPKPFRPLVVFHELVEAELVLSYKVHQKMAHRIATHIETSTAREHFSGDLARLWGEFTSFASQQDTWRSAHLRRRRSRTRSI